MTETSNTPSQDISSDGFMTKPGSKYESNAVASTTGSVPPKAPSPLRRVCVSRKDATGCRVSVAYSEKQASQGRRREEINKRMMG